LEGAPSTRNKIERAAWEEYSHLTDNRNWQIVSFLWIVYNYCE
jgi:hypothetical protein